MNLEAPQIDKRGAKQLYEQAVKLAKIYCPEWKNILKDSPDEADIGIVLLRLFSKLTETVIGQLNRIPEKHLLAFYDFIGIDHLPPAVAKVPLTFKLTEGSKNASVPDRTKVASSEDPTVVFETIESLTAVSFNIKSACSINPWNDKYTDHTSDVSGCEKGFYLFGGDEDEKPVEHILYVADDAFDCKKSAYITINIVLSKYNKGFEDYFSKCSDGANNEIKPDKITIISEKISFDFKDILLKKYDVDNIYENWISFRPKDELPVLKGAALPEISKITFNVAVKDVIPDAGLFNDSPVDIKKGFYPFGEMPKVGDAFYIGSDEAFSKKDANININLNLKGGVVSNDLNLSWEYWNGSKWIKFVVNDGTNRFTITTETGKVTFQCPDITTTEINGISSRWIRVRLESGSYGEAERYVDVKPVDEILKQIDIDDKTREIIKKKLTEENITLGVKYIGPKNVPPFINSLTTSYSYFDKAMQKCKTYNYFGYKDVDLNKSFKPFVPLSQEMPEFYIGFDDDLLNKPLALYFPLKTRFYNDIITKIKKPDYTGEFLLNEKAQGFVWNYYNGKDWSEFGAEDDTDFLSKSGIVKLIIPSNISKKKLFGEELFWIKVELKYGLWYEPPIIRGVLPNTVWAENAVVIKDELLGSSNGQPAQAFNFSSKPILEKQIIEIKEPGIPSEDELEVIKSEEGSDALRIIKNESGDIEEVRVRWHEVKTFAHSKPLNRHYIVDRVNGQIMFGDGINGMIPPALPNNILAGEYKSGGGQKGNQEQNVITELKTTIPNIDSVTNYDSASGGKDLEKVEDILKRVPHTIKNRERAVTREDFEWLAREASPEVVKTKCIRDDGNIKVIIAPDYEDGVPYPEASLTDYVETYLKERAFAPIIGIIEVVGPEYKSIDIDITIVPVSISESAVVADRVVRRLRDFLNPLKGGQDGKGWDFGEDIFLSEVAATIEDVDGVDYVTELTIKKRKNNEIVQEVSIGSGMRIDMEDTELVCAGEIKAEVKF